MQVVEDDEERRQDRLDDAHEEQVGQNFAEEQRRGRRGSHALRLEDGVPLLAGPCLVQGCGRREEDRDPKDSAGDLARQRRVGCGIEGEREDDDDKQRKEQHSIDGIARPPLDAEIFSQVLPDVMEVAQRAALVRSATAAALARR